VDKCPLCDGKIHYYFAPGGQWKCGHTEIECMKNQLHAVSEQRDWAMIAAGEYFIHECGLVFEEICRQVLSADDRRNLEYAVGIACYQYDKGIGEPAATGEGEGE
jgi:hypothetical protein